MTCVKRFRVGIVCDEPHRAVYLLGFPRPPPGLAHVVLAALGGASEVAGQSARDVHVRRFPTPFDPGFESPHLDEVIELEAAQARGAQQLERVDRDTGACDRRLKVGPRPADGPEHRPMPVSGEQGAHVVVVTLDDDDDRRPRLVYRARERRAEVRAVEPRVRVPERVPSLEIAIGRRPVERDGLHRSRRRTHLRGTQLRRETQAEQGEFRERALLEVSPRRDTHGRWRGVWTVALGDERGTLCVDASATVSLVPGSSDELVEASRVRFTFSRHASRPCVPRVGQVDVTTDRVPRHRR